MGPVRSRGMFGGFGIFHDDVMFGLIAYDVLYFKVDDGNIGDYEDAGSEPFTYEGKNKPIRMSYWRVPDSVYDSQDVLIGWGEKALEAARRNKKPSRKKRARKS